MDTPSGIKDSIPAWIKFSVQAPGEIPYNGIYYDPPEEVRFYISSMQVKLGKNDYQYKFLFPPYICHAIELLLRHFSVYLFMVVSRELLYKWHTMWLTAL